MAVKWNKVYRGPVDRTTPYTREVTYTGEATSILPGTIAYLDADDGIVTTGNGFFYFVGEQMHGDIDENQVGLKSSLRLYTPRSGDEYAARAAAGITLADDLPLTGNANGQLVAATGGDAVLAYVDLPASAYPKMASLTTVANQIIPVKIK